jgi:hypothetical protein
MVLKEKRIVRCQTNEVIMMECLGPNIHDRRHRFVTVGLKIAEGYRRATVTNVKRRQVLRGRQLSRWQNCQVPIHQLGLPQLVRWRASHRAEAVPIVLGPNGKVYGLPGIAMAKQ